MTGRRTLWILSTGQETDRRLPPPVLTHIMLQRWVTWDNGVVHFWHLILFRFTVGYDGMLSRRRACYHRFFDKARETVRKRFIPKVIPQNKYNQFPIKFSAIILYLLYFFKIRKAVIAERTTDITVTNIAIKTRLSERERTKRYIQIFISSLSPSFCTSSNHPRVYFSKKE